MLILDTTKLRSQKKIGISIGKKDIINKSKSCDRIEETVAYFRQG